MTSLISSQNKNEQEYYPAHLQVYLFSNSAAAFFIISEIGRLCGQCDSHFLQATHFDGILGAIQLYSILIAAVLSYMPSWLYKSIVLGISIFSGHGIQYLHLVQSYSISSWNLSATAEITFFSSAVRLPGFRSSKILRLSSSCA